MSLKSTDLITVTHAGKTYQACRQCVAHMERTITRFAKRFPGARFVITQGPWNVGVAASAGTHDKCACFDITVYDISWLDAQKWFRQQGWAAWYRPYSPGVWPAHIHMISFGCQQSLGIFVPGQISDYRNHRTGLKGHAADPTWFPPNIEATRFTYDPEMDMANYADTLAAIQKDVAAIRAEQKVSAKRERKTNDLLRKVRDEVKDSATLAEIDALLADSEA